MDLGFRLAGYFISANMAVLAGAGLFFAAMALQNLRWLPWWGRVRLVGTSGVFGVVGAYLYGMAGFLTEPAVNTGAAMAFELHFGSFGGFWGVLLGAIFYAALTDRRNGLLYADAIVPALLAGGAIARVADLFTQASAGRPWRIPGTTLTPFTHWAVYDIAALVILFVGMHALQPKAWGRRPGGALLVYLLGYGALRFLLEFARFTQTPFGPFTWGQLLCAVQFALGLMLLAHVSKRENA
jgi:hypothetical protein